MRHPRTLPARWALMCVLVASCTAPQRPSIFSTPPAPPGAVYVVAREAAVARRVTAATAPAIVARVAGGAEPSLTKTRVGIMIVGPIATVDRTSGYGLPGPQDLVVAFTPPAIPARQDFMIQAGPRSMTVHVREPAEAKELARTTPHATLLTADIAGGVQVPLGPVASRDIELHVRTTAIVPWREGAYELDVPRATGGDVALTADAHGPGPLVVMSSPSHAIDVTAVSLEHNRVTLRDPATLRDDDFVLRYRVDPRDRPGAFLVEQDGAGAVIALLVHPFEASHEAVAAADVAIDWNGTPVTEVRPATIGPLPAGTPLVVLARTAADVRDTMWVRARVGRETRTVTLTRCDAKPGGALASLWARAGRPVVTAKR